MNSHRSSLRRTRQTTWLKMARHSPRQTPADPVHNPYEGKYVDASEAHRLRKRIAECRESIEAGSPSQREEALSRLSIYDARQRRCPRVNYRRWHRLLHDHKEGVPSNPAESPLVHTLDGLLSGHYSLVELHGYKAVWIESPDDAAFLKIKGFVDLVSGRVRFWEPPHWHGQGSYS